MFIICYICSSSVHIWPFSNLFSPMTKNRCTSRQEVVTCLEKPAQPTGGGALLLESGWWGIIAHTRNFQRRWNYNCRRPNVLFSLAFHFKQGRRADDGGFSRKPQIRKGNQWSMEKPIRIALAAIALWENIMACVAMKAKSSFYLQLFYFVPLFEQLGVEGLASPWTYLDVTLHSLDVCYQYQYKRCYLQMFSSSVFLPKELLFVGCAALAGRTLAPMWRRQSVSLIFPNCTQALIHSCQTFAWFRSTET